MLPCDVAATLTSSHACKSEVSSRSQKEDVAFVVAVIARSRFAKWFIVTITSVVANSRAL